MVKINKGGSFIKMLGNKIATTIISSIGWLVFVVYWAAFEWSGYTFFQNLSILVISLLVVIGVVAVTWTRWGR